MFFQFLCRLYDGLLYHLLRLCRLRTASEKVARGFALGIIPQFFPTFGVGALISPLFAKACGGNGLAGFASGALFTPAWPFFFYLNLKIGSWVFHEAPKAAEEAQVLNGHAEALSWGRDFSTGAVLNSLVFALVAYLAFVFLYERFRPALFEWVRCRVRQRRRIRMRTRRLVPA